MEVQEHLLRLPRQQRMVLVLRFFLGYSDSQIADALDCSVGTVKSNAPRALAKLRPIVGEEVPSKGATT